VAAVVDGFATALALAGNRASVRPADRVTWLTWVPWSLAANAVSGQAIAVARRGRSAAGGAAIAAAMAAAVAGDPEDAAGTFVAGALFWTVARRFRAWLLGTASALAEARAEAVRQQAALAAARERAAQLRLLHDHAVQTLEAVAGGLVTDRALIRDRAMAEADRLEDARAGARRPRLSLPALLRALAADEGGGWSVTLAVEDVPEPSAAVAAALGDAAREALLNVRKHARATRVAIACRAVDGGVEVTVTDDGRGFVPDGPRTGFGLDESVLNRMVDVGGRATVTSGPGAGARVVLWGPA
jgi:hypothetical protein